MFTRLEAPILYVTDVQKASDFYVKGLGFSVTSEADNFVMLSLGATKIALNGADDEGKVPGHQTIIIISDAIEHDYEKMTSFGVHIELPLSDPGYGRTFIFRDRDCNKIEVVESA
jgi:predicted enzyme related to lactoylglutathione lyase